ncbi:hypothetical protein TNCV_4464601 [Trichonephila clavipes]|nr:hypothetical protein TNCV_4464601 [Trichonephila clavipes]
MVPNLPTWSPMTPNPPNWPPTCSQKMMTTYLYRQDFAKFSLNLHYQIECWGLDTAVSRVRGPDMSKYKIVRCDAKRIVDYG